MDKDKKYNRVLEEAAKMRAESEQREQEYRDQNRWWRLKLIGALLFIAALIAFSVYVLKSFHMVQGGCPPGTNVPYCD